MANNYLVLVSLVGVILLSSPAANSISTTTTTTNEQSKKRQFVLVHGACHGGWSWYKVSTILESWGHKVTALDMAAAGIDRRQAKTITAPSQYFEPLMEFMAALDSDEKVVLVGHSYSGFGVAGAMEAFPDKIFVAVFVAAVMPGPTLSSTTVRLENKKQQGPPMDGHLVYENGSDKPPTGSIFGPLELAEHVYQLSPPEDLTLAKALLRPHPLLEDNYTNFVFTTQRYGVVKRAFFVTDKDLISKKSFQMWMIDNNPPDIIVEIKGSDHMAMASNPLELAYQLQRIAHHFSLATLDL